MTDRLGWHVPDNLRWLAEQADRPDYVPCGKLTGAFLIEVARQYERMAAALLTRPLSTTDDARGEG